MRYVLFVCNHNAGRSQMAKAFFERHAPAGFRAESAGTKPAKAVWPEVVTVMSEVGLDLSAARPQRLDLEMQLHADWAVTMGCGDSCPYVPTTVEAWDLPDPAGRPIEEVREIRDEIERRVRSLVTDRLAEIQTDRTAHNMRLARLIPMLVADYGDRVSAEDIRAAADEALAALDGANVRSHLLTLARRRAADTLTATAS